LTTFEFALALFNLYGIIFLTVWASTAKYGLEKGFAIFGIVCFALSLTLRLAKIYVGA
jgi:uncharacterized protein with PQ loop repeat